jgi:single-stranded-DNA-specific exonuclease
VVVYHADADGISAAALSSAAIEQLGGTVVALTPPKGKNVYDEAFRTRLVHERARLVLVLDTGSRAGTSWRETPTVIVDHHVASSAADAAAFVHDERAVSTSTLVLDLLEPIAPAGERSWLAAVGALGDRGDAARREPCVVAAVARFGVKALRDLVALVNASGRASAPQPELALESLREMDDPHEIVRGSGPVTRQLIAMQAEVAEATRRARHVAPRVRGRWAIIEIEDACRVHGVIASSWSRRLAPKIVLVANKGYVEGRVHIAVRSHERIDLRAALRELLPNEGDDYAAGHARATGAIVDVSTYERLLTAIDAESARSAAASPRSPTHVATHRS